MKIVFVADYFFKDFPGGSERSLQALIDAAPRPVNTVKSSEFRLRDYGPDDFLIFGNFSNLPLAFLPEISRKFRYAVIESDFKYCEYRSPEQHKHRTGRECDCHKNDYGQRVARFYEGAEFLFWKSAIHMDRHLDAFPLLALKGEQNIVLSATYTEDDLNFLINLSRTRKVTFGYAVFKSDNWIKGYSDSVEYCKKKRLWRFDIQDDDWQITMRKLAHRKGLVFLPRSMESCSRISIEAHILGLDIIVNNNVPVAREEWFSLSREKAIEYLRGRTKVFWNAIESVTYENITCAA